MRFFIKRSLFRRVRVRRQTGRGNYLKHKEAARALVLARIEHFNNYYKLNFKRISIRNQRTRWGSCSRNGNLNFNYKLALIPEYMADYVIVHELCHLKEFNHSKRFWALVGETIPNFSQIRQELRQMRVL